MEYIHLQAGFRLFVSMRPKQAFFGPRENLVSLFMLRIIFHPSIFSLELALEDERKSCLLDENPFSFHHFYLSLTFRENYRRTITKLYGRAGIRTQNSNNNSCGDALTLATPPRYLYESVKLFVPHKLLPFALMMPRKDSNMKEKEQTNVWRQSK